MNSTVVDSRLLAKIKKTRLKIESLNELEMILGVIGGLSPKQLIKKELLQQKLTKLIKQLP